MPARARDEKVRQQWLSLRVPPQRGGRRKRAGRKPVLVNGRRRVLHSAREAVDSTKGLSITLRIAEGLPSLRMKDAYRVILEVLRARAGRKDAPFRVIHFSVLSNHMHLICEATDRDALTSGMRSLNTSLAKRLNALWRRRGPVFADRFHSRVLSTPVEARNAVRYVLKNAVKHGIPLGPNVLDPFSSEAWTGNYLVGIDARIEAEQRAIRSRFGPESPCSTAHSWLLRSGWLEAGVITPYEAPLPTRHRRLITTPHTPTSP
jgi:REP element-mobilizing transposase RayT